MTAADLIARAARDIAVDTRLQTTGLNPSPDAIETAKKPARKAKPQIEVDCDLTRPSCRRWLALAKRKASHIRRASRD